MAIPVLISFYIGVIIYIILVIVNCDGLCIIAFQFLIWQCFCFIQIRECKSKMSDLVNATRAASLAVHFDQTGQVDKAVECYRKAARLLDGIHNRGVFYEQTALRDKVREYLERVTILQEKKVVLANKAASQRQGSVYLKVSGKGVYTEEEKEVLRQTSNINNNCFLPFMHKDLTEKFQYDIFEDRASELKLSSKQEKEFDCWIRPHEICSDPKLIVNKHIDCLSIKQTVVADCSFVASLAVCALHEIRFGKKIISRIIYPQNTNGDPMYNPCGKYMVKLHLNGVWRKIIIDDRLPWSRHGRLLCSYSSNKNEFWVSMLEKAYMKVMGGYDFPGSNSALTAWIPERIEIRHGKSEFNSSALYETIRTSLEKGEVLVTVGTGPLPDDVVRKTGLVPKHEYAVLDVRLANGVKLLKLKNPWSHLRWKGRYSELDTVHWTPGLQGLLNYDPKNAAKCDNGVFWIDYTSILKFFEVFYLTWTPELFDYNYCIHEKLEARSDTLMDDYVGENPQFSLHVQGKGAVWLLLTRHITDIDDFQNNQQFITLLVYKNNGKKVHYSYEPFEPYIDGVHINTPHYLCKIKVDNTDRYTLVVSQYAFVRQTIYYTIKAYATCPFTLEKLQSSAHCKT